MLDYLNLTKPRISLLFAITGLAALLAEGTMHGGQMAIIVLAIFMTGGAANGFNQFFERDVDKLMGRTAKKRPLPQGKITPRAALTFSIITGAIGNFLLWYYGSPLAFALGIGTIAFYSFYYTLWLKPRTPYNIVIGGIAGATGPLIGWAAATGSLSLSPLIMFLIIFMWTPPHFWALALCHKEDYTKVNYPMLPLVVGDAKTRTQILLYSIFLIPLTLTLAWFPPIGTIYLITSILFGIIFLWAAFRVYTIKTRKAYMQLFGYSILYLLLLFIVMIIESLIK